MKEIIFSFLRHSLTAGGGALAAKGYLASGSVDETVGAVLTILGVVWSIIEKRKKPTV